MGSIFHLFTNRSISYLLWGSAIVFSSIIIIEIVLSIINSLSKKTEPANKLIKSIVPVLRWLIPFELVYLFFKLIEKPEGALYPWNLVFNIATYIILLSGLIIPVYKFLNTLLIPYEGFSEEKEIKRKLLHLSNRGIKITIFFLAFSIILWNAMAYIPETLKKTMPIRVILFINVIIISIVFLLFIQKSMKSVLKLLEEKRSANKVVILVKSLFVPVQFLIGSLTMIWVKSMIVDSPLLYVILDKSLYFLLLAAILVFANNMVEVIGSKLSQISVEETNSLDKTLVEMIRMILRIALILSGIVGVYRIISGKPLTTLLAGLGIGGLALALAAQDTLKNFFGSLMIMTDKPFKIGERILIKDYDGVIEAIGFRSTRIRTLVGHQVIIPNDQMASNSIENIGRRPHIRRLTNITITYNTKPEKVEQALSILKEILNNHEGMSEDFPPRVYFSEFNADSLNIIMIYWYTPPDYWKFMAFSEEVNLKILHEFNKAGIEFAFPTSTTYLEQEEGKSIKLELNKALNEIK